VGYTHSLSCFGKASHCRPPDEWAAVGGMSPGSILVVDDDQQVREVIGEYLERCGYRIALANDRAAGERILHVAIVRPCSSAMRRSGTAAGLASRRSPARWAYQLLLSAESRRPSSVWKAARQRELTRLLPAGQAGSAHLLPHLLSG
jgi:hypothetical protein